MLPESWYYALAVRLNECARPARQVPAFALGNLADPCQPIFLSLALHRKRLADEVIE